MPRQEWGGIEPLGKIFLLTFPFIGLADLSRLMRDPVPVRCKGGALGAAFALSGGGGLRQESAAQAADTNSV